MKKFAALVLLAILGIFVAGRIKLGESGAMNFLARMESLTSQGKAAEVCDMFHEDLEISIVDRTSQTPKEIEGGKDELCELTRQTVDSLGKVPHRMSVEWNDVEVTRGWWHPWTSEVTYTEERALSLRGVNISIHTTSQNTITLVQTLSGVKLLQLDAEAWLAE